MVKFTPYAKLMRLDRPIGILLFLWPPLWALWIAAGGHPPVFLIVVFITGVVLMRSAGCIINDLADQKFDGKVKRTSNRPLVSGLVNTQQALILLFILLFLAANLLWFLNTTTLWLVLPLLGLVCCYPFMKRITHLPQLVLGVACNWGVLMAFTEITHSITPLAWGLFAIGCLWSIAYDTIYAMVDRDDDQLIGVKSTAILFGNGDIYWVGILHLGILIYFIGLGVFLNASALYFLATLAAAVIFIYEQKLISSRSRENCFRAFRLSYLAGLAFFLGIVVR
jgi:4-hydroxybenzoate polyprenyltransferase